MAIRETSRTSRIINEDGRSEGENVGTINVKPKAVLKALGGIIVLLSILSILLSFLKFQVALKSYNYVNIGLTFFSLDREENIPTYFSSFLLFFAAALLFYVFLLKSKFRARGKSYWGTLSFIFLLLSIEEFVGFHELSSDPLKAYIDVGDWFLFTWIIPAAIIVVIVGIFYLKFVLSLPPQTRNLFIVSGVIFIFGAVGLEVVGGYLTATLGDNSMAYALMANLEEVCEMTGVSLFIYALLKYIGAQKPLSLVIKD